MEQRLGAALDAPTREERLSAAARAGARIESREEVTVQTDEVNNHVHTIYSFSPYSPSEVSYRAWKAGLRAVGCMDHDSVSGALELGEACRLIGIGSTVGCELRVSFTGTLVEGRKINNPDSANIVYIALHGIPHDRLDEVDAMLRPIREARNRRNVRQVERLNALLPAHGIEPIDFARDVYGISQASSGGSVTERHILSALATKIIDKTGKGPHLISFLTKGIGLSLPPRLDDYLRDEGNPHYLYDVLGVLKSLFLPQFFIQPDSTECVSVFDAVELGNRVGAIPAYAYLGDVTESPTGDKTAEKFEDSFLDELVPELKRIGFKAVTYMPPRNTIEQLKRVQHLCAEHELMEISGVDINSSRQSFTCPEVMLPEFRHLVGTTWALVAHEHLASADGRLALFSPDNPYAGRSLPERIAIYAEAGASMNPRHPERLVEEAPWNRR